MAEPVIKVKELKKTFSFGNNEVTALRSVNLEVGNGEFLVIFGPSGCGKTTLLSLLAGLDKPTAGTIEIRGDSLSKYSSDALAQYRQTKIGMVFQQFNLVPTLSARDNIALPLLLSGIRRREAYKRAVELLKDVGLKERTKHKPAEMSGGEQQRVAICRALAANPYILFVDEPTGNLDEETGGEIMETLRTINKKWGRTIILVTHNRDYIKYGDRVCYMRNGQIEREETNRQQHLQSSESGIKYYIPAKKVGHLRYSEVFRLAQIHFFSRKLRTVLTTMGVALGVGSIVTLVSFGVGLQRITSSQLASLDALTSITVSIPDDSTLKMNKATVEQISKITNVAQVSPSITTPAQILMNGSTSQAMLTGYNQSALGLEGIKVGSGKEFSEASSAVITTALAKNFNLQPEEAVGKELKLSVFNVLGQITSSANLVMNYPDNIKINGVVKDDTVASLYMPLATVEGFTKAQTYSSVKVKANSRSQVVMVRDELEKMGLVTSSVSDLIDQVDRVFLITEIVLGVIGGVALVVALIGIINIMTISLLERTHEIGIIKAIGARNRDIRHIFQYETLFFGLAGGVVGVLGAWLFGQVINILIAYLMSLGNVQGNLTLFVTPLYFALEMVTLSIIVSMIAGWYPAKRASRLSPLEALHYE